VARLPGGSGIVICLGLGCGPKSVLGVMPVGLTSDGGLGCIHVHSIVITCMQRVCCCLV